MQFKLQLIRVMNFQLKALDNMALKIYKPLEEPSKKAWYEIFETDIAWRNVIIFVILHGIGIYGAHYLIVNRRPDIYLTGGWVLFVNKLL